MKKYVLFVCGHNSGRSQMGEVYFNTHNKNPDIEAKSAGTAVKGDGKINPKIILLLEKHSIDILNQDRIYEPKVITGELVAGAEEIYTMGCMDGDMVGDRQIDYDFGLADPAKDDTNVDVMFEKFVSQIEPILKKYNS